MWYLYLLYCLIATLYNIFIIHMLLFHKWTAIYVKTEPSFGLKYKDGHHHCGGARLLYCHWFSSSATRASFISPSARARWTICSKRVGFSCGKTKLCNSLFCRSNCWYALWLMMRSCSALIATTCGAMPYSSQTYRISASLRCLRFSPISRCKLCCLGPRWRKSSSHQESRKKRWGKCCLPRGTEPVCSPNWWFNCDSSLLWLCRFLRQLQWLCFCVAKGWWTYRACWWLSPTMDNKTISHCKVNI